MSDTSNVAIIQDIYAAFGRGDIAAIIERLADDVSWRTHFDPVVPWSGDYPGKAEVPRFFEAIAQSVDVTRFEPQQWIAQHDTVVSTGRFGGKALRTGRAFDTAWVFIWKLRDGKVVSYEQFHDPAIADAFR